MDVYFSFGVLDVCQDSVGAEYGSFSAGYRGTRRGTASASRKIPVFLGLGGAAGDDCHRSLSDLSKYAAGANADDLNGLVAREGGADHRLLHAHEGCSVANEVADDVVR